MWPFNKNSQALIGTQLTQGISHGNYRKCRRIQLTIPFMVQTKCRDYPIPQPERKHNLYDFKQLIFKKKRKQVIYLVT